MKGLLAIFLLFFLMACDSGNVKKETKEPEKPLAYFYYPKSNVYVDTAENSFIYFDSAAKKWTKGNPPASLLADLGKSVLIDSAPQPVWSANAEHRIIYAASLYADSSDFKEQPVAAKPKKKKNKNNETGPDEAGDGKKKTRLGELINKIFKRKDKDQNQ